MRQVLYTRAHTVFSSITFTHSRRTRIPGAICQAGDSIAVDGGRVEREAFLTSVAKSGEATNVG